MKYSRHFVIALMSTPAMGFVVPLGNNGVLHPTYPQSFKTFRSRSDDSALRMAVDPIGTNIVLSNLPILLAPIAALSAGLASLGQRNQIQEEIATTEIELESIKKRLESSNLQINVSFLDPCFIEIVCRLSSNH